MKCMNLGLMFLERKTAGNVQKTATYFKMESLQQRRPPSRFAF